MRQLLHRRPSPSLLVAIAAVVVAGTGSAVAATAITSKQIRNGTIQLADLSKATRAALQGGRGPQGAPGATGSAGSAGSAGAAGVAGAPGAYPTVLPSGQTLTGAWANIGNAPSSGRIGTEISFPIPLASPPTGHFIPAGGSAAQCPGSATAPAAAPGHLCIFEGGATNVSFQSFEDPITGSTGSTTRTFGIDVVGITVGAGNYRSSGSWAVTAP